MTPTADQLSLVGVEARRDESTPSIPARPTPDAILRGRCPECGQYPAITETTGLMVRHSYHRSDIRNRRGRCVGTKTIPTTYHWLDPEKIR